MSQLLLSDLTALSSETKRKHAEIRTASDVALAALRNDERALLKTTRESKSSPEDDVLLKPIILACSVKGTSTKVIGLAVGLFQRVISMKAVREDKVHLGTIVDLLSAVVTSRADVDVHLKVLQVISSLLSSYDSIHDELLSRSLHLCFRLQDSRIAVVSSTAAATLRQAVMTIFEKVREEDKKRLEFSENKLFAAPVQIPGSDAVSLLPCSRDAFAVITDLNALANGEEAPFLSLHSLPKTFTLELIESILTNHAHLFRPETHPELIFTLRQSTCPLLIKAFNEQSSFPTTLRLMRLLFVLLRQFSLELVVEVEVLMSILLRCMAPNKKFSVSSSSTTVNTQSRSSSEAVASWQRVLAMEATRSLCVDGVLLRKLWIWFDGKPNTARVFTSLVDTLHQLATENPAMVGTANPDHQMSDTSHQSEGQLRRPSGDRGYSMLYGAAAGMANAAISGFTAPIEASAGLTQTSVPGVQLIDQLDKSEAPTPPPTYLYLLALQSLVHLAQSLAAFVLPAYSRFVNSRPKSAPRAPPALDFTTLTEDEQVEMLAVKDMLQHCWAPLLNSFTFFLTSKCDDALFNEVLIALRNFTNATGVLGLPSPRDALIATLTRFAVPRSVISKLVSLRGKTTSTVADDSECTLSERNAACLRAVTQIAYYLSGSLGTHWRDVLETLCDAEFVLRRGGSRRRSRSSSIDGSPASPNPAAYQPKASMASFSALSTVPPNFYSVSSAEASKNGHSAVVALDSEALLGEIGRVFENTQALGKEAFLHFLESLCELDSDSIGLAKGSSNGAGTAVNRSFPLSSLTTVAMLNVSRLTKENAGMGWDILLGHLLLVCRSPLRPTLRMQAAEGLDSFLNAAFQVETDDTADLQRRCLAAITEQSILDGKRQVAADIDVRRTGLETLLGILEKYGHTLVLGWENIFALCAAASAPAPSSSDDGNIRSTTPLVKVAFTSLQLVCSDLLTKLNLKQLEGCVTTLILFSKQKEDVNVALTANGTIWAVTAEVSARAETEASGEESTPMMELWVYLLKSVLELTSDARIEVRNGAIAILFNILEQYGSRLSKEMWTDNVLREVLFPLLDSLRDRCQNDSLQPADTAKDLQASLLGQMASDAKQWEESRVLALSSTGKVVSLSLYDKLMQEPQVVNVFLQSLKAAFLDGPAHVSQAAIRAMQQVLQVDPTGDRNAFLPIWQMAWRSWATIGEKMQKTSAVYTQANLFAYVSTLEPIHALIGQNIETNNVSRILSCLKTALTYSKSREHVSDTERPSALQSAVLQAVSMLHSNSEVASMILADLAEYSMLVFSGNKQVTYIALNRASTAMMLKYYSEWSQEVPLYESKAVDHMFAAFIMPLKLRYDCPRGREEQAIWRGSLTTFCKSASLCCATMDRLTLKSSDIADIYGRMVQVISAALGADCTAMIYMTPTRQEEEQNFDLTLVSTIERDIWPYLGKAYVPELCISDLARAISFASRLHPLERKVSSLLEPAQLAATNEKEDEDDSIVQKEQGLAYTEHVMPRESFAYWCFDLLLLISAKSQGLKNNEDLVKYKRVSALFVREAMHRVSSSLSQYVQESRLRGTTPTTRRKEEEICYIFDQLLKLDLWPHSMLFALEKLSMQDYLQGEESNVVNTDVAWLTLRQSKGLIYHLYPLLVDYLLYCSQGRGTVRSSTVACGSSIGFEKPPTLPVDFQLATVGNRRTGNPTSAQLKDPRELARALLEEVGSIWR